MTTVSSSKILLQPTSFLDDAISQSDLRHCLLFTVGRKTSSDQITLRTLTLASETLDTAISTTIQAIRSSSLRLTEQLLPPHSASLSGSFLFPSHFGEANLIPRNIITSSFGFIR
ncbi:hypothetical protein MRB53_026064 [Persea americana]|uniref:Uncharacterized protein n=1 Tax=Persea americana TaxID=3435 RepID=A0ACC2LHY1_PERAE|nr:hypothetical protein MRB53_026064 [Persea americana]